MVDTIKLLFICSRNKWRSLTAEKIFQGFNDYEVRSLATIGFIVGTVLKSWEQKKLYLDNPFWYGVYIGLTLCMIGLILLNSQKPMGS